MSGKRISIITVSYNAISCIEKTINSVLSQAYDNIEYIIIDGSSTDGTIDIIKKYKSKLYFWLSEKDQGIYDAMNKGVRYATGDYICFMNCGDTFYNNLVIKDLSPFFLRDADIIYGNTCSIQSIGSIIIKAKSPQHLLENMPFCHQSSFTRRECLLDAPFDLNYKYVADYNFFYNSYMLSKYFIQTDIIIAVYNAITGFSAENKMEVFREVLKVRKKTDSFSKKVALYIRYYRYIILEKCKIHFPKLVTSIRKIHSKI